jgi:hypothetical protein
LNLTSPIHKKVRWWCAFLCKDTNDKTNKRLLNFFNHFLILYWNVWFKLSEENLNWQIWYFSFSQNLHLHPLKYYKIWILCFVRLNKTIDFKYKTIHYARMNDSVIAFPMKYIIKEYRKLGVKLCNAS